MRGIVINEKGMVKFLWSFLMGIAMRKIVENNEMRWSFKKMTGSLEMRTVKTNPKIHYTKQKHALFFVNVYL